jgi:gamma-glutamylputrescine oxidase
MSAKTTRRSFLKGCAVSTGALAAAAVGAEVVTPLVLKEKMEFDENESLWALDKPPVSPALAEDIEVDVAIVGGGYTGLSSGYHIKKLLPEKSVAIIEARSAGNGASGRNGGMVLTQPANEAMYIYSNPKTHKLTYEITNACIHEMQALMEAQGFKDAFHINGSLKVMAKESHVAEAKEYAEAAPSLGIPVEYWGPERVKEEIGTDIYYGALFDPNTGEVNPMKLVHGQKKAAEAAGCVVYETSPVTEIEEGETIRLKVESPDGNAHTVTAKSLVLATNAYTSKLGYFKNQVIALHTQCAVTRPLADSEFDVIGWRDRIAFYDSLNLLYHVGLTEDGRALIGAGNADYFFNGATAYKGDITAISAFLHRELERIWPGLAEVPFEYVWDGPIGFSLDFNQSVGVTGRHKNIYYGLAYVGHGVTMSFLFGKIIADLLAGDAAKWKDMPFLNHRFPYLPPEPLRWVGTQGYKALLRIEDSI